jgi:hypothetical protein
VVSDAARNVCGLLTMAREPGGKHSVISCAVAVMLKVEAALGGPELLVARRPSSPSITLDSLSTPIQAWRSLRPIPGVVMWEGIHTTSAVATAVSKLAWLSPSERGTTA